MFLRRCRRAAHPALNAFSARVIAAAICSRWLATASGTMRSSAFMTSTISSGLARSIEAVRGLRRSVTLGSIIPFGVLRGESRPNLPAASSEPQEHGVHVNKYILLARRSRCRVSAVAQVRRRAPDCQRAVDVGSSALVSMERTGSATVRRTAHGILARERAGSSALPSRRHCRTSSTRWSADLCRRSLCLRRPQLRAL